MNFIRLSHDGVTLDVDRDVSTVILLVFIRRWDRLFTCRYLQHVGSVLFVHFDPRYYVWCLVSTRFTDCLSVGLMLLQMVSDRYPLRFKLRSLSGSLRLTRSVGGKVLAQLHTTVRQICFPDGMYFFLSLFSLLKNWMHNVVWGRAEILLWVAANKEPAQEFKSTVVLSYINGVTEVLRRCLQHQDIRTVFKSDTTLRSHLVWHKDTLQAS